MIELFAVTQLCGAHGNVQVIRTASQFLARNLVSLLSACRRHSVRCIFVYPFDRDLGSAPSMLSFEDGCHASHALVDSCAFHGGHNVIDFVSK